MDLKDCYDRVLLVVFGLIAIAAGIVLTMKALALPASFDRNPGTEKADYGESGLAQAEAATAHLKKDVAWASASMPGVPQKALRLTVSPPVWVKDNKEFDLLDPETPQLRPPLENIYVHEHGLPAGRSDLVELDLDGDGFTNLREFEGGKTDPNDKNDHPEFSDKLRLAEVKKNEYNLDFRSSGGPGAEAEHMIRETTTLFQGESPRRKTHYPKVNEAFGVHPGHENRYQVTGFEAHQIPGRFPGVMQQADKLTVEDTLNPGNPFQLQLRQARIIPTYFAVLYYGLPGIEANLEGFYKVGDTFELPNQPGVQYEILELSGQLEDGVNIRKLPAGGAPAKDFHVPPK